MDAREYNFDIIEKAGITQQEVARLLGVSRVTVNKYCKGHVHPHSLVAGKVERFLNLLEQRVAEGRLPIDMPPARQEQREARLALIRSALQ